MKKYFAVILAAVMLLALASCGKDRDEKSTGAADKVSVNEPQKEETGAADSKTDREGAEGEIILALPAEAEKPDPVEQPADDLPAEAEAPSPLQDVEGELIGGNIEMPIVPLPPD